MRNHLAKEPETSLQATRKLQRNTSSDPRLFRIEHYREDEYNTINENLNSQSSAIDLLYEDDNKYEDEDLVDSTETEEVNDDSDKNYTQDFI